ncbi:MAG: cation diffusion facilitator family transporter [Chthoniobacteraceae bacterium]
MPAAHTHHRLATGARFALLGIVVNCVLAAVKITAGVLGHAYALIADGIESLLDIFGSLAIWWGLKVAAEPPDADHPYGHGKAEPLAALIVSFVVLGTALALAVQSVREILIPHHTPKQFTLYVLLGVVVVKELLHRKVLSAGHALDSSAVKTDAWHHRADAITSTAAFIGISIALFTGWAPADDWAALFACGFIAWNGSQLLRSALRDTMDTASPELEESVRAVATSVPGVAALDICLIRKSGLEYFVDLHVGVNPDLSVRESHRIAHAVRDAIRGALPSVSEVLVHIEPEDELED